MKFRTSHEASPFVTKIFVILFFLIVRTESLQMLETNPPRYSTAGKKFKPTTGYEHFTDKSIDPMEKAEIASTRNPAMQQTHPQAVDLQKIRETSRQLFNLLSSAAFSESDPFQYLLSETSKLQTSKLLDLNTELKSRLSNNTIPKMYMPYTQALYFIIYGHVKLIDMKQYIQNIRSYPFDIPSEISSPPELSASGLFSSHIFSDPYPPLRLYNQLLQIPKNDIPNIIVQLRNYKEMARKWDGSAWRWYAWYADHLISFFNSDSILEDLKRTMAKIQPKLTSAKSDT